MAASDRSDPAGCLLKDMPPADLEAVIRTEHGGRVLLDPLWSAR